jgi:hypothetical protein
VINTLIDVSDISIRLWKNGALLCDSPSAAHIDDATILFGEQALAKSRSEPQGFCAAHWSALDLIPLKRASKAARHHADLVYRHLESLSTEYGPLENIIFIVPGDLNHEQLALLLGIAQSLKLNVVGMVNSAVANAVCTKDSYPSVQYLELGLFRTTISTISMNEQAHFESAQNIERAGQDYLSNLGVKWVADCFLDQARFDPLQHAHTEQVIFDHLDSWIGALAQSSNINVEIEHLGRHHSVSLSRNVLLDALRPGVKLVTEALNPELPVVLSHRFNIYPEELFETFTGRFNFIKKTPLEVFTAVDGRLQNIVCSPDEIAFTRQLNVEPSANAALTSVEQADGT